MNTFIRLPAERQRLFYEEGQQRLGLAPASIEKDFWVCWTLRELFNLPEWGERLTFKGGTSLSKCWRLIFRFSAINGGKSWSRNVACVFRKKYDPH